MAYILRVPIEQASGYNFFYGKPLSEVDNAAAFRYAPEAIKKFIGFQEITGTRKDGTTFTLVHNYKYLWVAFWKEDK